MTLIANKLSFNGGEMSPNLDARFDIEKYRFGNKQMENFWPTVEGPAYYRPGTIATGFTKDKDNPTRLEPFVFSDTTRFILEMGVNYIRFWSNYLQVTYGPTPPAWLTATVYARGNYVVESAKTYYCIVGHTSTTFATDLADGNWIESSWMEVPTDYSATEIYEVDVLAINDVVYFAHPDHPYLKITRVADDNWTFQAVDWDYPPLLPENVTDTTVYASAISGAGITLTASTSIFSSDMVGGYFAIEHQIPGKTLRLDLSATSGTGSGTTHVSTTDPPPGGEAIELQGDWSVSTVERWAGELSIYRCPVTKDPRVAASWTKIRSFNVQANQNISAAGTESDRVYLAMAFVHSDTDPSVYHANYWRTVPTSPEEPLPFAYLRSDEAYFGGFVKIVGYTSGTVVTADVKQKLFAAGAGNATKYWSEGAFSDKNGHPRCHQLYEGALVLIGHDKEPKGVYKSVDDDFENFKNGTKDADAMFLSISGRRNVAQWAQEATGKLFIGTLGEEVALSGAGVDEPLTPTSFKVKGGTYYGSEKLPAVNLNDVILFVQSGGKHIRELVFNWESEGYQSIDLTRLARHIGGNGIKDVGVSRTPYQIWWGVRNDGQMIGLLYERIDNVVCWFRTKICNSGTALIDSVCTIPDANGNDEVWISTRRTIGDGTTQGLIERFDDGEFTDAQDAVRMDECYQDDQSNYLAGKVYRELMTVQTGYITPPVSADYSGFQEVTYKVETAITHALSTGDRIRMRFPLFPEIDGKEFRAFLDDTTTAAWATSTAYLKDAFLTNGGKTYKVQGDYTSASTVIEADILNGDLIETGLPFYLIHPDPAEDQTIDQFTDLGGTPAAGDSNAQLETTPFKQDLPRTVFIDGVVGTTEMNKKRWVLRHDVHTALNDKYRLDNTDSSAWTAYTSGGTIYSNAIATPADWTTLTQTEAAGAVEVLNNSYGVGVLSYLKGEPIVAMLDGQLHEGITVANDGSLTLPVWANKIKLGVHYPGILETMKIEFPIDLGSTRGRQLDIMDIILSLKDSYGLEVGTDDDFLSEVHRQETTDTTDSVLAPMNGEYRIGVEGRNKAGATVIIKQNKPLPATLLGLSPKIQPTTR